MSPERPPQPPERQPDDDADDLRDVTALLREPEPIDPVRRDQAIGAALALGAELYPASDEPAPTDEPATRDELAARRAAPVPVPRHAERGGRRRGLLVAAAVVLVGAIGAVGLAANLGSGGSDMMASSGGDESTAEVDDSLSSAAGTPSEDSDTLSRSAEEAEDGTASDAAPASTTTSPPTTGAAGGATSPAVGAGGDLGTFDAVSSLLDHLASSGFLSTDSGAGTTLGATSCDAESTRLGRRHIGRAVVGPTPVLVAVTSDSPPTYVVLDAITCIEVGRR